MWLGLVLMCLVSSCSSDEEQPDYMAQLYSESQTLPYQTADSIESFTQKFYGYLEYNPDAYNHPYYSAIDEKIYELKSKGVMINTDWAGEEHLEY